MTEVTYDPKLKQPRNAQTGLPIMEPDHAKSMTFNTTLVTFIYFLLTPAIGFGIGYAIYSVGDTVKYDSRISTAKELGLEWAMLSLIVF